MAKRKHEPDEESMAVEEVVVEETVETEPVADHDDFVTRTLKAINRMENSAKAERLANRLLRKRR